MASIERGFCSVDEYLRYEETRIKDDELAIDALYIMMVSLKSRHKAKQAAKLPTRVLDVQREDDSDLVVTQISILNTDLTPDLTAEAVFRDGFWHKRFSTGIRFAKQGVRNGYFRDFSATDEFDRGIHELVESTIERPTGIELPVREAIPA